MFQSVKILNLKGSKNFTESMVERYIAENPSVLGLGNLEYVDSQKRQDTGIVDLILQNSNEGARYIVEIMLGKIDESHIIRLIEYWDIEKRKNPSWNYKAVLIAENTTRFLNVLHVIQYSVPITVIQMVGMEREENQVGLFFTKVFEGLSGENEDIEIKEVDRDYWKKNKTNDAQLAVVDTIFNLAKEVLKEAYPAKKMELNYVTPYIGITIDGKANNFMAFVPNKSKVNFCGRYSKDIPAKVIQITQDNPDLEYQGPTTGIRIQQATLKDPKNMLALKDILKTLIETYLN